jgi:plastocyanin
VLQRERTTAPLIRLILSLFLLSGWGMPAPAQAYEVAAVGNAGSLTGSVKLAGAVPRLEPIPVRKNQEACGRSVPNEALVLGPNKGVKGGVILVEGVARGKKVEGELILDNARCLFVPHVSAVMAGAPAKIRNSDQVQHNAHGLQAARSIFNLPLSFKGRVVDITARLKQPGVVKVLCDVHAHMSAWLVVHDSPYFAVTDETGNFRIDGIPPGKYTVTMWHEGFFQKGVDKDGRPVYEEQRVKKEMSVPSGGAVRVDFELK